MGVMKKNIPAEITSFKEKFFFGLTVRQLICGAGILALAVPTGIFGSRFFSQDTVGWLILVEVSPLAAIGWFNYNDMPIEVIGKKALKYYVDPQKRKYKYKPTEVEIHEKLIEYDFNEASNERSEELRQNKLNEKQLRKQQKAEKKKEKKSKKRARK